MIVGEVIGNIWATRKSDELQGHTLLIVQPINLITETAEGSPIVAADLVGAGVGEVVLMVCGSSAHTHMESSTPIDASVVGIVDDKEIPN